MAQGTVKWFNDAKGFGFITPEDGSKEDSYYLKLLQLARHYLSGDREALAI